VRELTIETVGAQGDGVADGVFTPLTLPGELVLADIVGDRAELIEVLTPSADRVAPPCPHFGDCGGCALQHWASPPYLEWKREQIRLALERVRIETDILPTVASAAGSRRRLALHARRRDGAVILGFKARRSWRVVPIEACAIADPRLVDALPLLRAIAAPFLEHPASAPTLHVTLTLTGLDIDVTGVERKSGGLSADARARVGQTAAAADVARVTLAGEPVYLARAPVVEMDGVRVALPAGAFLQASGEAQAAMAAFVQEACEGGRRVADLYCGVGAFSLGLARRAPVLAADVSAEAVRSLSAAAGAAPGLKSIDARVRDLERRPLLAADLAGVDRIVFDPPRAGAADQCREIARSASPVVVGISCNPATFARDAAILGVGGLRLRRVLPVDQFLWSPHIELVGVFTREAS
jgi:23S rRNA (uracil1939-C5)-methyltransferase